MPQQLHSSITKKNEDYRRVAIFGAGVSGHSARSLAQGLGMKVCLFDEGGQGDVAEFHAGMLDSFDAFIFSPGFAANHPWRILVKGSARPCYSELGFAAQRWRGRLIGVTGTNGKTTLTSLLGRALRDVEINVVEAGNIGVPLSDFVLSEDNCESTYAVCEISSFQAELTLGLQLDGLVWTNFAEDHLNRYASMEDYFAAKRNLMACLRPKAPAFLGVSARDFDSTVSESPDCFIIEDTLGWIENLAPESPFKIRPQSANFALAVAFWRFFGFPMESLIGSANAFQLAPHRLSRIAEWGGVSFWNDSKATNFHAALAAMDALKDGIYWICGGSYKGGDLRGFARSAAEKVRMAFFYGEVSVAMEGYFRESGVCFESHTDFVTAVQAAVRAALQDAPSAVLLSPGFASFDQFPKYTVRGDTFTDTIFKLKDNYCTD